MSDDWETKAAVNEICTADSLPKSYAAFMAHKDRLAGWRFIFASEEGNLPGITLNRNFANGSAVRSLFQEQKVFVLDADTIIDMERNQPIHFDYSISLDTNALSCLEPFISGKTTRLPQDFHEVFRYIASDETNIDPMPYTQENMMNVEDIEKAEKIFLKFKGYEFLRSIDAKHLEVTGELRSLLTDSDIAISAQKFISRMLNNIASPDIRREVYRRYNTLLAILLKMCEIQLSMETTLDEKTYEFVKFLDEKLATIMLREIIVARKYFELGQNFKFFGKFHIGSKGLFSCLSGMAWDLLHLRECEERFSMRPDKRARYFFSGFLTFDKKFIEIIDACPIKSCAISPDGVVTPLFAEQLKGIIPAESPLSGKFNEQFFTEEASYDRARRRDFIKNNLEVLVYDLAQRVSSVAKVPLPSNFMPQ